jgi:hypothetical protein
VSSRPCNRCLVEAIRRQADAAGATVHLVPSPLMDPEGKSPGFPDGVDVFVVPRGAKLDTSVDAKGNHGQQWKMWAAGISEGCAC